MILHAAPERSADLFHVIPAAIGDAFTYLETDAGRRLAIVSVLDRDAVAAAEVEVVDPSELGRDELTAAGTDPLAADAELALRLLRREGVAAVAVPPDFPLWVADHLRAGGIDVGVDQARFMLRRRAKTAAQLAGIRRAQGAADAAMGVARDLLHSAADGLTSEGVRAAMQAEAVRLGCDLPDDVIVAAGPQSALGHESGYGPIAAGVPVVVDIWPRDRASSCWADMTRTFVAGGGEPPAELARSWSLCMTALGKVVAGIRPGVAGGELYGLSCEPFEAAGIPTQRTKPPGTTLEAGYYHSLGHGVGLELHERPYLGRASDDLVAGDVIADDLVAGDVIAVEPGTYRPGFGGCRLEDLVLVTEDGCEVLTRFPYDL